MHAKSGLRVFLKWKVYRPDSVIAAVIPLTFPNRSALKMTSSNPSTLTSRVAAVQFKMLHIQFRVLKIGEDQKRALDVVDADTPRQQVKATKNVAYCFLDTMVCMEHIFELINDIFATPELREHMEREEYEILNKSKDAASRWKPVRNKVGGHLDLDAFISFCDKHNYKGVFVSDDLEADLCALNLIAIGAAINASRNTCDIFGRDIDIISEMNLVAKQLKDDSDTAIAYFDPISRFLYRIGMDEKKAAANPEDLKGIIRDE